jgi:hypothetical protein
MAYSADRKCQDLIMLECFRKLTFVYYGGETLAPGACTIKYYRPVMYGKWTDFKVNQCLMYCRAQTHTNSVQNQNNTAP